MSETNKPSKVTVLSAHLCNGASLINAADRAGMPLREAINYLKTRESLKSLEADIVSEIGHTALEVGLRNLIELADTCMLPEIRCNAAKALVEIGFKLKQMGLSLDVSKLPLLPNGAKNSLWKFDE